MNSRVIVVMSDPVVAMDLTQILQSCRPASVVESYQSLSAARLALSGTERAHLIIAQIPTAESAALAAKTMAGQLGDHMILLSDGQKVPFENDCGVVVLPRPFTDEMIAEAVFSFDAARCWHPLEGQTRKLA